MNKEKDFFNLNSKKQINLACWICFAIVMLLMIYPLLNADAIGGHDSRYHCLRIAALKQQLVDGTPFLKINTTFFNDAGYASSMCYPDIFLYIPAFLAGCGIPVDISYNIFLMLCVVACYFTTYISVKLMTKSSLAGTIAAVIFSLSQYHLDNLYERTAVGEIQAFIFLPLVVYGIYDYLYNNFKKPWIMGIGFAGLILSHTISTILSVIIYIVLLAINYKKVLANKKNILKLIYTAAVVALVTCYYWGPLLELISTMDLAFSHPTRHTVNFPVSFKSLFGDVTLVDNVAGIGISIVLVIVTRFFFKKSMMLRSEIVPSTGETIIKKDKFMINLISFADTLTVIAFILIFMSTKYAPWNILKYGLDFIQFPWRLFLFATIFLSFSAAIYALAFVKLYNFKSSVLFLITGLMFLTGTLHLLEISPYYKDRDDSFYAQAENTTSVGGAEWLPILCKENRVELIKNSDTAFTAEGNVVEFNRSKGVFTCDLNEKTEYIIAPMIYYTGYSATLTDSNGKITNLEVVQDDNLGFCKINLPEGGNGKIELKYAGTIIQFISDFITIATLIALVSIFTYKKLRK